jgi:tripartite-type tricarboxylate transporter receptor subunit TctC
MSNQEAVRSAAIPRRSVLLASASLALPGLAHAQAAWPSKQVRLVVPYGAGGGVDRTARIVAQRLGTALRQPFVVENRPGANTALAADTVAKAEPDGHTLLLTVPAILTVNPSLYATLPYKVEDLEPVAMLGRIPLFVVTSADSGAKTMRELVDKARQQEVAYASAGTGSMTHLGAEQIKAQLGLKLTHVPYKGTSTMVPDVAAGRVEFALSDIAPIKGLLDAGKVKVLATTAASRSALLPAAPSMTDSGVQGVDVSTWVGIAAPKGTPAPVMQRLSAEILKVLDDPAVKAELLQAGIEVAPEEGAALRRRLQDERERWRTVIKAGNITAE